MSALGGFDDTEDMPLRPNTPASAPSPVAADTSAADKAALVQCQAELSACRDDLSACKADLSKEKAENASLKAALEEASAKIAALEEAQAAARAKVEAAAKDFSALTFGLSPAVGRKFCGKVMCPSLRLVLSRHTLTWCFCFA